MTQGRPPFPPEERRDLEVMCKIADRQRDILTAPCQHGRTDLLLAATRSCRIESVSRLRAGRSRGRAQLACRADGGLVHNGGWKSPGARCQELLGRSVGEQACRCSMPRPSRAARRRDLCQPGAAGLCLAARLEVPVQRGSLRRAIELNATAVEQKNLAAFEWGHGGGA